MKMIVITAAGIVAFIAVIAVIIIANQPDKIDRSLLHTAKRWYDEGAGSYQHYVVWAHHNDNRTDAQRKHARGCGLAIPQVEQEATMYYRQGKLTAAEAGYRIDRALSAIGC